MKNRIIRYGVYVGAILVCIDLALWVLVEVVPRIIPPTSEFSISLTIEAGHLWYSIRLATHWLILPLLLPYIPSHGGGAVAAISFGFYVAACLVQTFFIGFVVGSLWSLIKSARRD